VAAAAAMKKAKRERETEEKRRDEDRDDEASNSLVIDPTVRSTRYVTLVPRNEHTCVSPTTDLSKIPNGEHAPTDPGSPPPPDQSLGR